MSALATLSDRQLLEQVHALLERVVVGKPYETADFATEVSVADLMPELGYANKGAFWSAVHMKGIPHLAINKRKIVFYRGEIDAWKARRSRHSLKDGAPTGTATRRPR